jgi:hypothetical protein
MTVVNGLQNCLDNQPNGVLIEGMSLFGQSFEKLSSFDQLLNDAVSGRFLVKFKNVHNIGVVT